LGLDPTAPAADLAAGARKRLELGRALAMDGALLLLDEPFAGAAPDEVDLMVAAIRRATAERGAAALVVDHDLDTVLALCDRMVALDGGCLESSPSRKWGSEPPFARRVRESG
ncbi:MAG: ABC transporter ATP-binding protein, partial [Acidimicrobiales bacterium]